MIVWGGWGGWRYGTERCRDGDELQGRYTLTGGQTREGTAARQVASKDPTTCLGDGGGELADLWMTATFSGGATSQTRDARRSVCTPKKPTVIAPARARHASAGRGCCKVGGQGYPRRPGETKNATRRRHRRRRHTPGHGCKQAHRHHSSVPRAVDPSPSTLKSCKMAANSVYTGPAPSEHPLQSCETRSNMWRDRHLEQLFTATASVKQAISHSRECNP